MARWLAGQGNIKSGITGIGLSGHSTPATSKIKFNYTTRTTMTFSMAAKGRSVIPFESADSTFNENLRQS